MSFEPVLVQVEASVCGEDDAHSVEPTSVTSKSQSVRKMRSDLQLPWDFLKNPSTPHQFGSISFSYPDPHSQISDHTSPIKQPSSFWLTVFYALLFRYTQQRTLDLDVTLVSSSSTTPKPLGIALTLASTESIQTLGHQLSAALEAGLPLPAPATVAFTFVTDTPDAAAVEHFLGQGTPDLHLMLFQSASKIRGTVEYNTHLFRPQTMERLIGHLGQLAEGAIAAPHAPIASLPLLTPAEEHQMFVEWGSPSVEYPRRPIFTVIETHAVERPGAIAITFKDQHLTYGELNSRANQLARYLQQVGVGPNVRVASCLEPSLDVMVAFLAIHKAGGVYVPLDPSHPTERLVAILDETQPPILVTQAHLLKKIPATTAQVFCLDQDWSRVAALPSQNLDTPIDLEQTAYIIYTSGTTGRPKGVMASHANLVNYIWVGQETYGFNPQDVMPAMARFTFSITMFELWSPLVAGGRLLLLERDHILDFPRMAKTLEEITFIHTSPSLWRKLIAFIDENGIPSERFARLRHVSSGGDMVPADLLAMMKRIFTQAEVYVIYGCSEISCMGCTYFVPRDTESTITRVGKPFPNVSVRLYDDNQNPVPIGVTGEIYFGGAGINQGYLDRDDLTADRFVWLEGQRFYRTGDLGRFDADGNLEILGRNDFQIKLRGIRMEPGEIEATLRRMPGVREAVASAQTLPGDEEKTLVAYVVLDANSKPTIAEIRQYLQSRLPDYMVPTIYMELEALPLNINGKVDRKQLPIPERANLQQRSGQVAARNELEQQLIDIWESVLQLQPIGIDDNFFELGGDSLTAAQVIYRLQTLCQRDVPISQVFIQPTIRELAEYLNRPAEGTPEQPPIIPIPRTGDLPLSLAQSRLWFLTQLDAAIAYNIPLAFELQGEIQVEALEHSLSEMVRRHEALRTTFPIVDGTAVQRILPPQSVQLPIIDLQLASDPQQDVYRLTQEEAQRPFQLATQLPIRFTLLRLSSTSHVLLLTVHHLVADGWSLALMRQELAALYAAFLEGKPSPLADLPFQYADYAHWQQNWLQEGWIEPQLAYWTQQLTGAPPLLELPTDHPRPPVQTYRGGSEFFTLDAELTRRLKGVSQQGGATLFMTLLTAFSTLLSRYSKHEDVVIGSPIANRNRSDIESLIGFFINMLPLRVDLSGNPSFLELLSRVRQVSLEAYANQDLPFDRMLDALQIDRNLSNSPLFQVMFILQNSPLGAVDLPGVEMSALRVESGCAKYDLTLMMEETADGLTAELEFNRDLFDRDTIQRMVGHFQMLLLGIVADPAQPVTRLPLLTQPETHQLLKTWNDTELAYPPEACIHQLFESQAVRTPEAIALIFGSDQLTYQALNEKANQLAHYLRTLGVGPEVLVGICIERSLEMVVGLLAILKAGGCYVPLDPAYPMDRLAYMIENSELPILLTEQALREPFEDQGVQLVCIDTDWETVAQHPITNPDSGVTGENLAYTIYTSGSTGKPKGVQLMHCTAVNFLNAMGVAPGLAQEDVLLAVTTISFDIAVLELYLPLMVGARVVIATREQAADAGQLCNLMTQWGVTVLQATPVTWHMLLARGWQGDGRLKMLCGGEAMPRALADQLLQRGGSLWNMYGPTETTVWSAACQVGPGEGTVPVAGPIANTQIYVLDNVPGPGTPVQLVPIGVPGEVHIGGDGLARGYRGRPDLTEERFIPDPFSDQPGARLYKTGDLARFRPDGSLEFLGRIDHQVKLRGFRIELGEIEAILTQHPAVKQGAVIVREDVPGDKRLVAYWTVKGDAVPTAQELRTFVKGHLPNYMVPSAFVQLDTMPLTPNGKIDRRSLPMPDAAASDRDTACVAPRTDTERQLVEMWETLLNLKPVSIHDDFFDLGGTSLLAVSLISQIQQTFGKDIPLSTLMTSPTLEQLAQVLQPDSAATLETAAKGSLVLIKPGTAATPLFLIHDGDGEILLYRTLAQKLKTDLPIYGVLPCSRENHPILHTRIPDMARYYVQQIRAHQPKGPYFLGGLCAGATLAFEIALQLQQEGQEVAMVAILDAADAKAQKRPNLAASARLNRFGQIFQDSGNASGLGRAQKVVTQATQKVVNLLTYEVQERFKLFRDRARLQLYRYYLDHNLPLPAFVQNIPVRPTHMFALESYTPQGQFNGEIVLFRATEKSPIFDGTRVDDTPHRDIFSDPLLGWECRVTEGVAVYDMPGGHSSMLQEPNVQVLVDQLEAYLQRTFNSLNTAHQSNH